VPACAQFICLSDLGNYAFGGSVYASWAHPPRSPARSYISTGRRIHDCAPILRPKKAHMNMKKTDLEMLKAKKILGKQHATAIPGRFGNGAAAVPDRREQRKLDQAAGLVPFATKLDQDLVRELNAACETQSVAMHELVTGLLRAGLAAKK
jgi:hypothetical protein